MFLLSQPCMSCETSPKWHGVYRVGAIASIIMILLIPIQILIFACWPPPSTVEGFYALLKSNWLLGLLSLDLIYIFNNMLLAIIYIAIYVSLKKDNESYTLIALILGLIGIAAYFPSNPAFEMFTLSGQYAAASTDAQRSLLLASGQTMLAIYRGTTFLVYYVLNASALLLFAFVMLRSNIFSRLTAVMGLIAGVLMIIPSTAGTIGLIFSIASLVPWSIFTVLIANRLVKFASLPS